ncbi:PREDICTED: uncharacterized protein LOC101313408 [Fragaria vesca subsp. vesca]
MARSLLLSANMPKYLWGEAVLCAPHLINRLPSAPLQGRVPFDVLSHYVPILSLNTLPARVFGCVAYVHLYKNQLSKLDARALKCVFVGYGSHQVVLDHNQPAGRVLPLTAGEELWTRRDNSEFLGNNEKSDGGEHVRFQTSGGEQEQVRFRNSEFPISEFLGNSSISSPVGSPISSQLSDPVSRPGSCPISNKEQCNPISSQEQCSSLNFSQDQLVSATSDQNHIVNSSPSPSQVPQAQVLPE